LSLRGENAHVVGDVESLEDQQVVWARCQISVHIGRAKAVFRDEDSVMPLRIMSAAGYRCNVRSKAQYLEDLSTIIPIYVTACGAGIELFVLSPVLL
jgi:hypothetical protein